ncbi:MAG: hypothetical protein ABEJ25_06650 [Candidatus Bipolaricaulia bacterium]
MNYIYIDQNGRLFDEDGQPLTYFLPGEEDKDTLLSDLPEVRGAVVEGDVEGRIGPPEGGTLTANHPNNPCRSTASVQKYSLLPKLNEEGKARSFQKNILFGYRYSQFPKGLNKLGS